MAAYQIYIEAATKTGDYACEAHNFSGTPDQLLHRTRQLIAPQPTKTPFTVVAFDKLKTRVIVLTRHGAPDKAVLAALPSAEEFARMATTHIP